MTKREKVNCKHCGKEIMVRTADLARGWGLYCSKSCKAFVQNKELKKKATKKIKTMVLKKPEPKEKSKMAEKPKFKTRPNIRYYEIEDLLTKK